MPHVWGDAQGTLARLEAALATLKGCDLVLLPELAFSGYVSPAGEFDARPFAEPLDGPTFQAVSALAARHHLAIAATLVERAGQAYFNAMALFDETGQRIGHWRKRHPWFPEHWATPGDLGTPVVEWRGLKIAGAICFDLHFLAEEAGDELAAADLLLFPSAWVESGRDSRVPLLRQVARRFQIAIANANWARGNPAVAGQGGSLVIDSQGRIIAQAKDASTFVLRATLPPP
jgi:predicted amidohydrolase